MFRMYASYTEKYTERERERKTERKRGSHIVIVYELQEYYGIV